MCGGQNSTILESIF